MSFFIKASQGSLSAADLFAQQAEYRQFFPNLIFVSLGWVTRWNIKAEMFVSFALAFLIAINLYRLNHFSFSGNNSNRMLLVLVTTLLVFSPSQFESWLLGEQIIYFIPAACITTSLCVGYSKLSSNAKLIICLVLSVISTFSSANGLICWLVIAPILFFNAQSRRKNWRFGIWVLCFLLNVTVYFYGFQKPSYTPSLSTILHHPLRGLLFFSAFLGAPLITSNRLIFFSAGLGALLITLFLLSFLYVCKFTSDHEFKYKMLGWLMLGSYSLITAIMVTVGRLGFGASQALFSRYITFSVYLLISLFYLIPLSFEHAIKRGELVGFKSRKLLLRFSASVLILLHLLNSVAAIRQMEWLRIRRLESKACLLLINIVPNECVNRDFPEPPVFKSRVNAINELGFLKPRLVENSNIKEIADTTLSTDDSYGRFEALAGVEGSLVASGWASLMGDKEPADAVLLTYQKDQGDQIIFAYAQMSVVQPSLKELVAYDPTAWRWQKSISIDRTMSLPIRLSAWAFDATTGKAHKLARTYVIDVDKTPHLQESETP